MKSSLLEAVCRKCVSISNPISGDTFSNKISITLVRLNMKETEHDIIFETS